MSHVRAIATVPTSDDPTGEEVVVNPASSAGRPIYEVHISNVEMIGVIPYPVVEEIPEKNETVEIEPQSFITTTAGKVTVSVVFVVLGILGFVFYSRGRIEEPDAIIIENSRFLISNPILHE